MIRTLAAFPFLMALLSSCASAPPPTPERPVTRPRPSKPVIVTPAPASDDEETKPVLPSGEARKKLAAGTCNDCFDCVDTVGFAPDGYRWACVSGKCVRTKLEGGTSEAQVAQDQPSKADTRTKSFARAKSACKGKAVGKAKALCKKKAIAKKAKKARRR